MRHQQQFNSSLMLGQGRTPVYPVLGRRESGRRHQGYGLTDLTVLEAQPVGLAI